MKKYRLSLFLVFISIFFVATTLVHATQISTTSSVSFSVKALILKYSSLRTKLKTDIAKKTADAAAAKKTADAAAAKKAADAATAKKIADAAAAKKAADAQAAADAAAQAAQQQAALDAAAAQAAAQANTNTRSRAS